MDKGTTNGESHILTNQLYPEITYASNLRTSAEDSGYNVLDVSYLSATGWTVYENAVTERALALKSWLERGRVTKPGKWERHEIKAADLIATWGPEGIAELQKAISQQLEEDEMISAGAGKDFTYAYFVLQSR